MEPNNPQQPLTVTPAQEPPIPEQKKSFLKNKWLLIGLGIILLLILTSSAYYLGKESSIEKDQALLDSSPSPSISASPKPTTSSDRFEEIGNNIIRYTSPELGISFTYLTEDDISYKYQIFRQGNLICITYDSSDNKCTKGQFVKIFDKNLDESLFSAIENDFLIGIDKKECFVKSYSKKDTGTVSYAEISYPLPTDPNAPFWTNADKCPSDYAKTNGIRYFMADSHSPDKYAFFSIGQYAISGNNKTPWQDTFQFTK